MRTDLKSAITALVSGIEPTDDLGREHSRNTLSWLAGTDDRPRHVDVALWFALAGRVGQPLPHLLRALDTLSLGR